MFCTVTLLIIGMQLPTCHIRSRFRTEDLRGGRAIVLPLRHHAPPPPPPPPPSNTVEYRSTVKRRVRGQRLSVVGLRLDYLVTVFSPVALLTLGVTSRPRPSRSTDTLACYCITLGPIVAATLTLTFQAIETLKTVMNRII